MRQVNSKYVFLDLPFKTVDRVNAANNLFQLHTYADKMQLIGQWQFVDLMGDIFRVMFEPVSALAQSINNTMSSLGLKENEYVLVHVSSRYTTTSINLRFDHGGGLKLEGCWRSYLIPIIHNAISCANVMSPDSVIYFASDNHEVVQNAVTHDVIIGKGGHVRPVGIHRDMEPLHSEAKPSQSQISDFSPSILRFAYNGWK